MDTEEFPPPPPEVLEHEPKATGTNNEEEDEGEQFDFDSGDEIPEADRQALLPPPPGPGDNIEHQEANATEADNLENSEKVRTSEPAAEGTPAKVNPYSVINISPIQDKDPSPSPEPSPQDECASPNLSGGYSVPVPCGYAVPSNLPLILPAYSSPVIIRSVSVDEEAGTQSATEECHNSVTSEEPQNSEDNQVKREDDALAKWVADPANTAWMENPDEVIYDDVPRENSDSEPEEMIYDDVENGDDGGNSSLEYGWSSSEFESYEEQSDSECKNGIPSSFLRGNHKRHLSHDLTRLKEHYEKKMKDLMANTVGAVEIQQLKQKHELKMQKLMRAAREGTKDGLEKTKAAVKKGRSFIRTKSFISQDHRSSCLEEEELNLFIDVDCMHTEAIMTPMPEGLSQQQVVRRYILGSVVDSEKNYVDALKRILEQYEKPLSDMEPKLLSERKLKMVFYRIKEILQCHSMFQIALASRVSEWDSVEMIGDVFVASFSKSMVLDAYSEYVNNFSTAVGILKKTCATKPAFLDFLKQCQESSPDRITLYGLMMKPIQRFPQFILLLQDMLKNTNKGHPDRLPLQMALTELETLAEKLNERKRDADQRCEIKQIAKAMNERYLNKLLSNGNRYLIRTDDMVETVYNDKGEIIKTKERRLFMLNDVLMCATVNIRSSYESSGTMTTGQRYLLKWSVPLGQVEVIEYGSSEGQGENCRFPPQHSAENVVINSKPNKLYMGPGQLYHDLQNLLHDLNVVGQISQLIGSLKGNYQNLNQSVAHDWTSGLQKLILKKEDEIRAADRCRIQLQLPGKQDKSGRPTFFTAVFNTFTPAIKQSWINNLQMAKLALAEDNLLGWFCVEDDGNQIKKEKHPLLVRHMPVMMAKQQEFKALKEKTELQAQLAALNMTLQAQMEHSQNSQQKQESLSSEVATLKQSCWDLERAMADLQNTLEAKNASLASSNNDLQLAEEQYQRLLLKVEDMQKNVLTRDSTVHDLRQQLASLQNQLQKVQLERTTLTNKLKASETEISSLQNVRQWYQQQLVLAQEARVRLQSEMANIQAGQMTQAGMLEHLKLENVALSQQLTETQHRSIKEKERIAAQLQNIEADMLDQEAAFMQIQEAKTMVEEDLQRKLEEFEDEKEQLQKMADSAATLEQELEQVKLTLHQRDLQLESLQQEHLDIMKQFTLTQETLHTKEQCLDDLQTQYDELKARLEELQSDTTSKDDMIQYLQNEKIVLEVALQAAKASKEQLEEGAVRLGEDTEVASEILEQLRQEMAIKSSQVENLQQENASFKKQVQKVKEQFLQQKVMVEAYRRDASSKDQLISELKATKKRLDSELKELKRELLKIQVEKQALESEHSKLQKEVSQVHQQMVEIENHLQSVQKERDDMETRLQSLQFDKEQMASLAEANQALKQQVEQMQEEAKNAITEQKQKMKRLGSDLTSAQKEMKAKHKAYENAVSILSRRLQESLAAKESAEAELSKLKAQITDGGNNQIAQERIQALETELQAVSSSKLMLEKELQEVISLTSQELEEYREKVLELEDELQESRGFRRKIKRLEEINKKLALELEHERGKLTGLSQSNAALREHNNILETALAKREADLVQLNLQVQAVLKRKEEEDQQMQQLIQALQASLEKEKSKVKDLKKQEAAAKADAAHNRRHYRAAVLELSEIKKELHAKELLVQALQVEVDKLQVEDEKHSQEVSQFQQELAEARSQLQLLQKKLDDKLSEQPVVSQEVEDLKWEVERKEREIETLKQQLDMSEQRSHKELEGMQIVLQNIKTELEIVREDLSVTQKDKFMLQAKVTELKNSMKSLLQQNQQLKLDLKHGKMKKRKELKGENNSSNPVTPVKIPDCPVPAALLEELLKPSTAVSKEPLKNLNSCLRQLKQEMDSLQRQMEEHTITVHESMSSWTQIEGQLMDLTSTSPATASDQQEIPTIEEKKQNCSVRDKEALTL